MAAATLIWPLALEFPYATGVALKKKKDSVLLSDRTAKQSRESGNRPPTYVTDLQKGCKGT